jgi:putative membrane protein
MGGGWYGARMNLLIRWALNALALWLTVQLGVGVSVSQPGLGPLLIAALVVGLVNAVVRPVMVILTLPITVLTFGLFLLVVNALALALASVLSPLEVDGFLGALLGALVLSVISALLSRLFRDPVR